MDDGRLLPRRRVGGRSARVRRDVLDAALVELAECGYGGLSMEAVARRAGVHKTTVYRQWPDRERLVTEAVMQVSLEELPLPDTGDLRSDLVALATAIAEQITRPRVTALIRALVATAPQVPAFLDTTRAFWAVRYERTGGVVRRAIDRGELAPDTDAVVVLENLMAPLYLRLLVTGGELSQEFVIRSVDLLVDGIRPSTDVRSAARRPRSPRRRRRPGIPGWPATSA
jgi:AcrR family transcriptional regulator